MRIYDFLCVCLKAFAQFSFEKMEKYQNHKRGQANVKQAEHYRDLNNRRSFKGKGTQRIETKTICFQKELFHAKHTYIRLNKLNIKSN